MWWIDGAFRTRRETAARVAATLGGLFCSTALAAGAAQAAAPGSDAAAASAAGPTGASLLGEVIVTARKRSERLQDVPVSMSVVSGAALNAGEHLRIEDLNQLAPSTNIVIPSPHQTAFSIRGLGANPSNDGLEQSAGVFLDGVYLGRPGMAALDLIDLSQVEMLRGPQGTLFGKNTTAGAVNITTLAPSFKPGGTLQATAGNLGYGQLQGTLTGPLVDGVLAGRLTAYLTSRNGWVRDTTTGQDLNGVHRDGVRGQLLFTPSHDFRLRLIAEYHEENDTNGATLFNSWGANAATWQKDLAAAGGHVEIAPNGDATAGDAPLLIRTRQGAFTAQADWQAGALAITSITGWRRWSYRSYSDSDGSSANVLNAGYSLRDEQFSQELRVATPKGRPVELVAGAYFFGQNLKVDQLTQYGSLGAAYLSGVPQSLLPIYAQFSQQLAALVAYDNSRWDIWASPKTRSYALFGQAVWHAAPRLDVTLGLRETYETKHESVWRPNPTSTATGLPVAALAYQTYAPLDLSIADWAPSGTFSVNYRFTPDVMVYASIAQGEKAGGVSTSLPAAGLGADSLKVKPEIAQDLELGVKSQFLGHRVTVNLNGFYSKVRDYQATFFDTPPGSISSVQVLTNVGRVRTRGVELEAAARPVAGLTLNATASYNDATYVSYPSGPCPVEIAAASCDLSGKPVAGAPRWIANLSAYYERPVADRVTAYLGAEYSWRSSYYGYLDDSAFDKTGDYGVANLRAGVRMADGAWDLSVWTKNLADRRYVASYLSFGSLIPGAYVPFFGDPRTWGVTLRAAF